MQGLRDPSFLPTKKKPAPAGDDDDGRINPAFNEVPMYSLMASLSGPETSTVGPWEWWILELVQWHSHMADEEGVTWPLSYKNLPKVVVAGGHGAQVRVLGVYGGVSRGKVSHSYISPLSRDV